MAGQKNNDFNEPKILNYKLGGISWGKSATDGKFRPLLPLVIHFFLFFSSFPSCTEMTYFPFWILFN